ncbi:MULTISPECIES: hypothetical protein [Herbaspirillum]|nr:MULTISPECIES: hypothetical protein [Herbaspirillum]MCP1575659.1 hypothetical protein [Herbaspirillum rubrisubalbicans]
MNNKTIAAKSYTRVKLTPKRPVTVATPEEKKKVATVARQVIIEHYPVIKALANR